MFSKSVLLSLSVASAVVATTTECAASNALVAALGAAATPYCSSLLSLSTQTETGTVESTATNTITVETVLDPITLTLLPTTVTAFSTTTETTCTPSAAALIRRGAVKTVIVTDYTTVCPCTETSSKAPCTESASHGPAGYPVSPVAYTTAKAPFSTLTLKTPCSESSYPGSSGHAGSYVYSARTETATPVVYSVQSDGTVTIYPPSGTPYSNGGSPVYSSGTIVYSSETAPSNPGPYYSVPQNGTVYPSGTMIHTTGTAPSVVSTLTRYYSVSGNSTGYPSGTMIYSTGTAPPVEFTSSPYYPVPQSSTVHPSGTISYGTSLYSSGASSSTLVSSSDSASSSTVASSSDIILSTTASSSESASSSVVVSSSGGFSSTSVSSSTSSTITSAPTPATCPASDGSCTDNWLISCGTDYYGADDALSPIQTDSFQACIDACDVIDSCVAVSYVASPNGGPNFCYLKDTVTDENADALVQGAKKVTTCPGSVPTSTIDQSSACACLSLAAPTITVLSTTTVTVDTITSAIITPTVTVTPTETTTSTVTSTTTTQCACTETPYLILSPNPPAGDICGNSYTASFNYNYYEFEGDGSVLECASVAQEFGAASFLYQNGYCAFFTAPVSQLGVVGVSSFNTAQYYDSSCFITYDPCAATS